jgi:hypothetical protein
MITKEEYIENIILVTLLLEQAQGPNEVDRLRSLAHHYECQYWGSY